MCSLGDGGLEEVFQPVDYLPYEQRQPNIQLELIGERVLDGENSWREDSPQGFDTIKTVGVQLRFAMEQGFPISTARDMLAPIMRGEQTLPNIFEQAIGEWAAFANGAHTTAKFEKFGCYWWDRFLPGDRTAFVGLLEGDNGAGSYGPAFTNFPTHEGVGFDQLTGVIEQMKKFPSLRNHLVSPWIAPYAFRGKSQKVLVAPCHGWMHFMINTKEGALTMHHIQRSGDLFVGVQGCNIPQYAVVGLVVANILGLKFKELVYTISDAHVYDYKDQIKKVRKIIKRAKTNARAFPTVWLQRNFTALAEMRPEHFHVEDYNPHPKMLVPTPI
ncbi:thymidylate synthase [candidate division Kazan bacterium RIFCSPHIGHO2_01_FULL_44_14]|uniref:Thymidylate synthase n=1 Tax=candidate division Kazan bacterium RIFCSPLOWO2_01_FULL_45_19 TaxID=1798538 RepID=A0A1F4NQN3_UNCK3|nr:hypothetical protein [uncultured bacterium]OGB73769.1 MAG: thymidylate synthase [candidate division Kazan bacterium RIFCSPLOWO2_01_FULL_45_19]OGB78014.1 MAG: thymidylate synthase [candidate division Kazan bacterium RIFCSPHIGHO2_01_FULL_44_14]